MPSVWNKISIPEKDLRNYYLLKKLSISQIAKMYKCSVNPVHRGLREYAISIRSISEAKQKISATKEELEALYIQKKFSTDHMGKLLGVNHATILNYLKKYDIARRSKLGNRKPVCIEKKILIDLYLNKKLTQKRIAQRFGHSNFGIQRWMKIYGIKSRIDSESHTKYLKFDFSGDLLEKAHMIGFRLGDLNVYKVHELVQVRCSTTKIAQVELIRGMFKKYGNVHVWKAKRGTFEIVALLNNSFDFLLPKQDKIEDWMMADKKLLLSFLAGYSDAESCIHMKKNLHGSKMPIAGFELATYDKNILNQLGEKLKELGLIFPEPYIKSIAGVDKRGRRHNKDCWRISIYRKDAVWKLLNWLELLMKHQTKLNSIVEAKKNIIDRNSMPYSRQISLEIA